MYYGSMEGQSGRVMVKKNSGSAGYSDIKTGADLVAKYIPDHPLVSKVLATCADADQERVVMEWGNNGPLLDLAMERELKDIEIKRYSRQMVQGIDAMHQKGLAHRDVWMANFVFFHNRLKVIDFEMVTDKSHSSKTCGGKQIFSPEAAGDVKTFRFSTRKNDVWALGYNIIWMITGQMPWQSPGDDVPKKIWSLKKESERSQQLQSSFPSLSTEVSDILAQVITTERHRISAEKLYSQLSGIDKFTSGRTRAAGTQMKRRRSAEQVIEVCHELMGKPGNGTSFVAIL